MKRVVIESPYYSPDKEQMDRNVDYAVECLRDSLSRGEAPFASHLLYTMVLDDRKPEDRHQGLRAAMAWIGRSDMSAIYIDHGVSPGMRLGIQRTYGDPFLTAEMTRGHGSGTILVRTLRPDPLARQTVHRIQEAYDGRRPRNVPASECMHDLDTPTFERWFRADPTDRVLNLTGWRCGCGQMQTGLQELG